MATVAAIFSHGSVQGAINPLAYWRGRSLGTADTHTVIYEREEEKLYKTRVG